jgi:hypothetical protein
LAQSHLGVGNEIGTSEIAAGLINRDAACVIAPARNGRVGELRRRHVGPRQVPIETDRMRNDAPTASHGASCRWTPIPPKALSASASEDRAGARASKGRETTALIDPLIGVRAAHFAGPMVAAGAAVFAVLVAEPVWQRAGATQAVWTAFHRQRTQLLVWLGLGGALGTGAAWLLLVAADITGESWTQVIADGMTWTVLTETQFGLVTQIRCLLAGSAAGVLMLQARWQPSARGYVLFTRPSLTPFGISSIKEVSTDT